MEHPEEKDIKGSERRTEKHSDDTKKPSDGTKAVENNNAFKKSNQS